ERGIHDARIERATSASLHPESEAEADALEKHLRRALRATRELATHLVGPEEARVVRAAAVGSGRRDDDRAKLRQVDRARHPQATVLRVRVREERVVEDRLSLAGEVLAADRLEERAR